MCGLVGILQADVNQDKDLIRFIHEGIYVDTLRGSDSTGVFQIAKPEHGPFYMYKEAVSGPKFLTHKQALAILADSHKSFLTVAHNRAATFGKVVKSNAHPFAFSKAGDKDNYIIGAHNGTLTRWTKKIGEREFDVDSEWAIHQMASLGIEEALTTFEGAWAFAAYDSSTPDKFYLTSNGQRPMHFCFVGDRKTMLFASDPHMLALLCQRSNLRSKENTLFHVKPNSLLIFNAADPQRFEAKEIKPKPVALLMPAAHREVTRQGRGGWDGGEWWDDDGDVADVESTEEDSFITDLVTALMRKRYLEKMALLNVQKKLDEGKQESEDPSSDKDYVTRNEKRFLTRHLMIDEDEDGLFFAKQWDPRSKVIHGEVTMALPVAKGSREFTRMTFEGQIRKASIEMWNEITRARKADKGTKVLVQAKGAFSPGGEESPHKRKYVIVVSHPCGNEDIIKYMDNMDEKRVVN